MEEAILVIVDLNFPLWISFLLRFNVVVSVVMLERRGEVWNGLLLKGSRLPGEGPAREVCAGLLSEACVTTSVLLCLQILLELLCEIFNVV